MSRDSSGVLIDASLSFREYVQYASQKAATAEYWFAEILSKVASTQNGAIHSALCTCVGRGVCKLS